MLVYARTKAQRFPQARPFLFEATLNDNRDSGRDCQLKKALAP